MEKVSNTRRVYSVTQVTVAANNEVGYYETLPEAERAIGVHYDKLLSKGAIERGHFYRIVEQTLTELNGIVYRRNAAMLYGGSKPFKKTYTTHDVEMIISKKEGYLLKEVAWG